MSYYVYARNEAGIICSKAVHWGTVGMYGPYAVLGTVNGKLARLIEFLQPVLCISRLVSWGHE
jgi:hypothetical protein